MLEGTVVLRDYVFLEAWKILLEALKKRKKKIF
jgi:hypothetical protein